METFDLDEDDDLQVVCPICNNSRFELISGHYYCSDCKTQSQQVREYADPSKEFVRDRPPPTRAAVIRKKGIKKAIRRQMARKRISISSWEVHNFAIKLMADKLIELGFPAPLKEMVFKIWTQYLVKRKAVLVPDGTTSKITLADSKVNLRALCNFKTSFKKRPMYHIMLKKRKRYEPDLMDDSLFSRSCAKRRNTMRKRKAMQAEYLDKDSQIDTQAAVFMKDLAGDEEDMEKDRSFQPGVCPVFLTEKAKVVLDAVKKIQKISGKNAPKFKHFYHTGKKATDLTRLARAAAKVTDVERFIMQDVMILLFVALRQIGCNVVYSDFIRLYHDGTLYLEDVTPALGDSWAKVHLGFQHLLMLSDNVLLGAERIQNFIDYVEIRNFNYPKFLEMLPKYIDDLRLPREVEDFIIRLNGLFPFEEFSENLERFHENARKWRPLIEFWVLSVIVVVLKLLFGLDDVTERYTSAFARKVNEVLAIKRKEEPSKKFPRDLFVLEDWFQFLRFREKFFDSEMNSPAMYRPGKILDIQQTNDVILRFAGERNVRNFGLDKCRGQEGKTKTLKFLSDMVDDGGDIQEMPVYTTHCLPRQDFVDQYKACFPHVNCPNVNNNPLLSRSFKNSRIAYVLNAKKYVKLLSSVGIKSRVIRGSSTSQPKEVLDSEDLICFLPCYAFDDDFHSSITSDSVNFLCQVLLSIISPSYRDPSFGNHNEATFNLIMKEMADLYSRIARNYCVPLLDKSHDGPMPHVKKCNTKRKRK